MARFMIERTFTEGLHIPTNDQGEQIVCDLVIGNGEEGVSWVHSYVSLDKEKTFCIYDAPDPEAIRRAAKRANLPVDKITQVSVLDPYFYH